MPVPMVKKTDYMGADYAHVSDGPVFRVREFSGQLDESVRIETVENLEEALRFGKYLEEQGHERYVMSFDPFLLKIAWYFSTVLAGLTDVPNEKEYAFSVALSRRFISMMVEQIDVEPFRQEISRMSKEGDVFLGKVRDSVNRNLKARGLA